MLPLVRSLPALLLLVTLSACRGEPPLAGDGLPALADLEEGWNAITPGGETRCSDGSAYTFFARRGDSDRLLLFFQGGGACWFGENCDLQARPTYDPTVVVPDDHPLQRGGLFDLNHPENPVAAYSMVYVPYCNADVHLGNRTTTYDVPATDTTEARQVTIHHAGYVNASAALDWAFSQFDAPQTVFVTGSSAGAIPSPFYAVLAAERYPEARVVQLGDGAGGYRSPELGALMAAHWGTMDVLAAQPDFAEISRDSLTFEALYRAAARRHPEVTYAQYNTAEDEVQYFFLSLVGVDDTPLPDLLEANYADIRRGDPDFHAYTAGGPEHTVLSRPEFYTYTVGEVAFRDWVAALIAGEAVADVTCVACAQPPSTPASDPASP